MRSGLRVVETIGFGYAGASHGVNAPELEHEKNIGPLPRGSYYLVERPHPRFASPAFQLAPTYSTARKLQEYGRGGFWVHGDNAAQNRSASSGCPIFGRAARLRIQYWVGRGHTILMVEA